MDTKDEIELTSSQIKEVAEYMDCGLSCFYHYKTKKLVNLVDRDGTYYDPIEEIEDEWEKIDNNWIEYFEFEKMESRDSFKIMESFIDEVDDNVLQENLAKALNRPKPFWNFKYKLEYNNDYKKQWFQFKEKRMIEWIEDQIQNQNSMLDLEEN